MCFVVRAEGKLKLISKFVVALLSCALLTGCELPRGAAQLGEVIDGSEVEGAPFVVVPVTQSSLNLLASWPTTGWSGHYNWPSKKEGSPEFCRDFPAKRRYAQGCGVIRGGERGLPRPVLSSVAVLESSAKNWASAANLRKGR